MKKYWVSLFFIGFLFIANGQTTKIDSLKNKLNNSKSTTERLELLSNLNELLISDAPLNDAIKYFQEMSKISKELDNIKLETKGYRYLSEAFMKNEDSINSLSYGQKALALDIEKKNLEGYLLDVNQLGRVYYHFQNYRAAIETYRSGIEQFEDQSGDEGLETIANIYSNLSHAYEKLGLADESINALIKGVEIAEKAGKPNQKSYGLYVLGYKYMELENYEKAEEYFLKSLTYSDSVSLYTFVSMNHHGLGINYSRWGKYKKALEQNKKALDFYQKQGDKLYEFDVLNNTAVVYERRNQPDSLIYFAEKALQVAYEINNEMAIAASKTTLASGYIKLNKLDDAEKYLTEVSRDTSDSRVVSMHSKAGLYGLFSLFYEGKKDYRKGLELHKKFKELNDSLMEVKLGSKFANIRAQYNIEKKEKENQILKVKSAQQELEIQKKKINNLLLGAFSTIALVIILFLFYLLNKRNNEKKVTEYKYQREVELLEKDKQKQQQIIGKQLEDIDNLQQTLSEKNELILLKFKEIEDRFHQHLTDLFSISEIELQYWIDQSNGVTEMQMAKKYSKSISAITSRGKRLRAKIKERKNIAPRIDLKKEEMTRYLREEWGKFSK